MRALPRLLLLMLLALPAHAAPTAYVLEPDRSTVGFATDFGQQVITGRMPVLQANLTLDFDDAGNTTIDVTLDVSRATASFPFAAQTLKGAAVLDARSYPTIRFVSTGIRRNGQSADVQGDITIRGITKRIAMRATIFRPAGQAEGDYSHLTVQMTGAVNRSDFGAVGFADMVDDEVRLDIVARIAATP
ncbi:MAG: YceI family protein [Paracoccaceae bacterium]